MKHPNPLTTSQIISEIEDVEEYERDIQVRYDEQCYDDMLLEESIYVEEGYIKRL